MAIKLHPSIAVHTGEWLRTEIVEPYGVQVNKLAQSFGVSRQAISALLNGRAALTADMAVRFEHAFGVKADTLMRMQSRYELAKARAHEDDLAVESLIPEMAQSELALDARGKILRRIVRANAPTSACAVMG